MAESAKPLNAKLIRCAHTRWAQFLESAAVAEVPVHEGDLVDLPGDASRVWAVSEFVARALRFRPQAWPTLKANLNTTRSAQAYEAMVAKAAADSGNEEELGVSLRRIRRLEMLRIAWRDIGGLADLDETVSDASNLADAVVKHAVAKLYGWLTERLGTPRSAQGAPQGLVVLALGKLGSHELNFSSDIDLIFGYESPGKTAGGPRMVENEAFFVRLIRSFVACLEVMTPEGFVFRVDTRLRPFGDSGPTVLHFDAFEHYYQAHGRDWERFAMLRARSIGPDSQAGEALLARIRPFVFRRYLDFGALESIREMKALIAGEVRRQGVEDNVKIGPGGIREVEFITQAFQVVRGGREPALREPRIRGALQALGATGHLPPHAVLELDGAYEFLRTAENRLQQMEDRQVHTVPEDGDTREALAAGMGYESYEAWRRVFERHRERVESHFAQVLDAPGVERSTTDPLHAVAWEARDSVHRDAIEREGYTPEAAEECAKLLGVLYGSRTVQRLDERGRNRLERLVPSLLRAAGETSAPPQTLRRLISVLEAIAGRSAYLALLAERPVALSQLVKLCAASPWISTHLARHPILLDQLLDPRSLYQPMTGEDLGQELRDRLEEVAGDTEQEMACLRQFRQAAVLRVAASDVVGGTPLMMVSDRLSEIAEALIGEAMNIAWRDLVKRHGKPRRHQQGAENETATMAAVAYGKLGGWELGYGSDLDLVFLHDADTQSATDGSASMDAQGFFLRYAQRVIHFLSTQTPEGIVYPVDPRLRPDGGSGLLVNSFAAYRRYLLNQAWTWEHQALVRARVIHGTEMTRQRFAAIRREALRRPRNPETLRRDVAEMRERMRLHLRRGRGFDLKQDYGGIADIEFMVQYLVLRWPERLGDEIEYTDNMRLLEVFAARGIMAPVDAQYLMDAYRAFRQRNHELALEAHPGRQALDEVQEANARALSEHRVEVHRIWVSLMSDKSE